jgi:drug/metabolite transporter (DMT)-like permease
MHASEVPPQTGTAGKSERAVWLHSRYAHSCRGISHLTQTAVCFGEPVTARLRSRNLSPFQWTCLGALAIPLWAMWPSLALRTAPIPPLETLTLAFGCGWLSFSVLHLLAGEEGGNATAGSLRAWIPALVYAVALSGGDLCFLLSLHRIPAAQANLLSYLWPVMLVIIGTAAGLFRLGLRQIAGLVLGFSGAVILIWDGRVILSASGIVLALLSGALWAAYCVFRLLWKGPTGNVLARGCGMSMLLCAVLHLLLEPTVLPSATNLAAMATSGFVALGLGNFLWDLGFRRGDGHLLAVMTYATPLCSALLLAAFSNALLTWNLLLGALVIVSAGLLSRTGDQASRS